MGSLMEYRRRILLNTPHLETAYSGNTLDSQTVATFKTDLTLPLKSMVVNFTATQDGEGDPSPDNVRPIIGRDSIKITRCGRNFFDHTITNPVVTNYSNISVFVNEDRSITITSDSKTSSTQLIFVNMHDQERRNNTARQNDMVKHFPNGMYKYRFGNNTNRLGFQFQYAINESRSDLNNDTIPPGVVNIGVNRTSDFAEAEITEYMKYNYVRLASYASDPFTTTIYPEIYLTSQSDGGYEPYRGDTYTISLPNTFYGGYVDVLRGELVQTHSHVVVDGENVPIVNVYTSTAGRYRWNTSTVPGLDYGTGKQAAIMASNMPCTENGSSNTTSVLPSIDGGAIGSNFFIAVPSDYPSTVEDANAWLKQNPIDVVYKLATPITYLLTPETIKTLKGVNNVFSDANGDVEVKFWTH